MEYVSQPLWFKLRKVLRYWRLYGLSRTWVKVRGQYHMKRRFPTLPAIASRATPAQTVGIAGCGNFAYSNIAYYLTKMRGRVIRGAMDVDLNRAASLCLDFRGLYYTDDIGRLIDDPEVKTLFIASNHATHAEYAVRALDAGKSVHIEKPHVVTRQQLVNLCRAIERSSGAVSLGFNRPYSPLGLKIREALHADWHPAVMNWFVAGHEIPNDHWYFREEEGGRILGNLCHWIDFMMQMVPRNQRYPIVVTPTRGEASDSNIAVTYLFGDGSIGAITFSSMGHTFEGVRERFAAHSGDIMIRLDDFHELILERVASKHHFRTLFRDHGHEATITASYDRSAGKIPYDRSAMLEYVWESGELFLATKDALDTNRSIVVEPFSAERLVAPAHALAPVAIAR
jgi:predicted dehydrogenase